MFLFYNTHTCIIIKKIWRTKIFTRQIFCVRVILFKYQNTNFVTISMSKFPHQERLWSRWPVLVGCVVSLLTNGSISYHLGVLHVALLDTYHQGVVTTSLLGALYGAMPSLAGNGCEIFGSLRMTPPLDFQRPVTRGQGQGQGWGQGQGQH